MIITQEELEKALALHRDWLAGKDGGKRLVIVGKDLSWSDRSGSDLSGSDLYAYAQVSFLGHGECGRMLTAIKQTEESEIYLCCGCFRGSEKDLKDFIANGEERFRKSRTLAMKTVLKLLKEKRA